MIKTFSNGLLGSNTHLYYDEKSREGMIIDCGNHPSEIVDFCNNNEITVKFIVLTHGHYDHAHYVKDFKNFFKTASVISHKSEIQVLTDMTANVSVLVGDPSTYPEPDRTVEEGDILNIGDKSFAVIHTPGHTPGGICLYCEEDNVMFTGDTLFCGGIGRTDFMYGNYNEMISSLQRLLTMDGDIEFYSGHGISGKIKYEMYE